MPTQVSERKMLSIKHFGILIVLICLLISASSAAVLNNSQAAADVLTGHLTSNTPVPSTTMIPSPTAPVSWSEAYLSDDDRVQCGSPENFLSGVFTAYDYSVVLSMLIISLGIGMLQPVIARVL